MLTYWVRKGETWQEKKAIVISNYQEIVEIIMSKIICFLFGHKLEVVKGYDTHSGCRKLYCLRCKRYYGINDNVRLFIPWDFELEDLYKSQT